MNANVEALTAHFLRDQADVAELAGRRIATEHPRSTGRPWIKVTQIGDPEVGRDGTDHYIETHLQLDCYGGDDAAVAYDEASALYRATRKALKGMPDEDLEEIVVARVKFGNGGGRLPDESMGEPARQRYVLDAFIRAHDRPE